MSVSDASDDDSAVTPQPTAIQFFYVVSLNYITTEGKKRTKGVIMRHDCQVQANDHVVIYGPHVLDSCEWIRAYPGLN